MEVKKPAHRVDRGWPGEGLPRDDHPHWPGPPPRLRWTASHDRLPNEPGLIDPRGRGGLDHRGDHGLPRTPRLGQVRADARLRRRDPDEPDDRARHDAPV